MFHYKIQNIILCVFIFLIPLIARAQASSIVITEIAASLPSDEEWVEIYNRASVSYDIIGWGFREGFTTSQEQGTLHKLTTVEGDFILDSGEYAVIAQNASVFLNNHKGFTGTLFDSSWSSLREDGEIVQLVDKNGAIVESFTYMAADEGIVARADVSRDDYTQANWIVIAEPGTPGKANERRAAPTSIPTGSIEQISNNTSTAAIILEDAKEVEELYADAGDDQIVGVRETTVFDASNSSGLGELLYEWNFDDGERGIGAIATHVFTLEGDYHVRLKVIGDEFEDEDKVKVTVVASGKQTYQEDDKAVNIIRPQEESAAAQNEPVPVNIHEITDALLGSLLLVEGEVLKEDGKIYIVKGGARLRLEIKAKTGINKRDIKEGDVIRITGLLDKTRLGFRLQPKNLSNIETIKKKDDVAPQSPTVLGESRTEAQETVNDLDFVEVGDAVEYKAENNERGVVYKYLIATLIAVVCVVVGMRIKEWRR